MTTGIVILCRYNSKRLPGKILQKIQGRTILSYIVERIKKSSSSIPIVVATTTESTDDPIVDYCRRSGLECFRGSLDDVASRFLECAEKYDWDYVVRINGDNLFLDYDTLRAMLAIASTDVFDFVSNVPDRTFPYGMSIEILRTSFYKDVIAGVEGSTYREHVTSWLYENPNVGRRFIYRNEVCPEAAGLKLALDTTEDLERAEKIIQHFNYNYSDFNLRGICKFLTAEKSESPWKGASGPLLISEIGGNHEGDFEVAKHLTRMAIDCGSDCVKFQLYSGDSLVSPVEDPVRNQHFKKFELTRSQHIHLAEMCRQSGVNYLASVWDLDMLEWIDPYLDFYKIGSGDMTAWPILEEFARRGKPIILSTGLSTIDEVLQTVAFLQKVNERYNDPDMLCILQCTSMYPIPDCDANLRVMDSLSNTTNLSVGYSDHTLGSEALLAAAAMGASVLEFHFTDTRKDKEFRDHKVSLIPEEVSVLKKDIERITAFRGSCFKLPQPSELENKHEMSFRRGVYLSHSIKEGEIISANDLVYLRPAHGTDARDADLLCGAKALQDIEPFSALVLGVNYARK